MTTALVPFRLFKRAQRDHNFDCRCCGEEMTRNEIRLVQAYRGCTERDQEMLNWLATRYMLNRNQRQRSIDDREGA